VWLSVPHRHPLAGWYHECVEVRVEAVALSSHVDEHELSHLGRLFGPCGDPGVRSRRGHALHLGGKQGWPPHQLDLGVRGWTGETFSEGAAVPCHLRGLHLMRPSPNRPNEYDCDKRHEQNVRNRSNRPCELRACFHVAPVRYEGDQEQRRSFSFPQVQQAIHHEQRMWNQPDVSPCFSNTGKPRFPPGSHPEGNMRLAAQTIPIKASAHLSNDLWTEIAASSGARFE
jgi:hypothetical protein